MLFHAIRGTSATWKAVPKVVVYGHRKRQLLSLAAPRRFQALQRGAGVGVARLGTQDRAEMTRRLFVLC